jgi:chromosome segregation ATPase
MQALEQLSKLSTPTAGNQPVVLESMDQYIAPLQKSPAAASAGRQGGESELAKKLREELATTKKDLVRAVQGWREDRDTFKKNMEAHIVSNSAKAIKSEMLTERKRLRAEIAKLQAKNKELTQTSEAAATKADREIKELKAKLVHAESSKKYTNQTARRTSATSSAQLDEKTRECEDLKKAVTMMMGQLDAGVAFQRQLQGDFDVVSDRNEDLLDEVENLKKALEEKKRPSRKAPPPPGRKSFDFGAFSDTKVGEEVPGS